MVAIGSHDQFALDTDGARETSADLQNKQSQEGRV
jgi:hypothetical protein